MKCNILFLSLEKTSSQCLKITEKVAFNFASEASYVYIKSGQKLIKMPKMVNFGEFLNATFLVIFKHCVSSEQIYIAS